MHLLSSKFKQFLTKPSPKTSLPNLTTSSIKNYVSDTDKFLAWVSKSLQTQIIHPVQLTPTIFNNYATWLYSRNSQLTETTATRHIASLRRFGNFLHTKGLLKSNPAANLSTPNSLKQSIKSLTKSNIINHFKAHLISQNLSPKTIKNYVSDINSYINWSLEANKITDRKKSSRP